MTDHVTALAGTMTALARSGGTKLVNGTTVGAPVSGVAQVDLGAGRIVPATVPGSLRANIVDGQKIKLLKNQTNNTYVVESVLTALTTPTVAAPPSASDITGCTDLAQLKAAVNDLRTTVADMRTALIAQGHIV